MFGGPSKLLGLITDGPTGQQKLREIIGANGKLPRTVTIWDGDRETRLFRYDKNYPRSGDITDNVRILGAGDFVVAPSSLDDSTGKRRFARGHAVGEVEIAQAPHWLFKIGARLRHSRYVSTDVATGPQCCARPHLGNRA